MANEENIFYVIKFIDVLYNIDKYVIIPESWVSDYVHSQNLIITAYPDEDQEITKKRVQNNERHKSDWPKYKAIILHEAAFFHDAAMWITTHNNGELVDKIQCDRSSSERTDNTIIKHTRNDDSHLSSSLAALNKTGSLNSTRNTLSTTNVFSESHRGTNVMNPQVKYNYHMKTTKSYENLKYNDSSFHKIPILSKENLYVKAISCLNNSETTSNIHCSPNTTSYGNECNTFCKEVSKTLLHQLPGQNITHPTIDGNVLLQKQQRARCENSTYIPQSVRNKILKRSKLPTNFFLPSYHNIPAYNDTSQQDSININQQHQNKYLRERSQITEPPKVPQYQTQSQNNTLEENSIEKFNEIMKDSSLRRVVCRLKSKRNQHSNFSNHAQFNQNIVEGNAKDLIITSSKLPSQQSEYQVQTTYIQNMSSNTQSSFTTPEQDVIENLYNCVLDYSNSRTILPIGTHNNEDNCSKKGSYTLLQKSSNETFQISEPFHLKDPMNKVLYSPKPIINGKQNGISNESGKINQEKLFRTNLQIKASGSPPNVVGNCIPTYMHFSDDKSINEKSTKEININNNGLKIVSESDGLHSKTMATKNLPNSVKKLKISRLKAEHFFVKEFESYFNNEKLNTLDITGVDILNKTLMKFNDRYELEVYDTDQSKSKCTQGPKKVHKKNKKPKKKLVEKLIFEDGDLSTDDNLDEYNQLLKRKPPFVLPPEYNPNDSKWTLKYQKASPETTELMPNTDVYVNKLNLEECTRKAKCCKSLARMLLTEVFSATALKVCSLTGSKAKAFHQTDINVRPGLDKFAKNILILFVNEFGCKKKWPVSDMKTIENYLRTELNCWKKCKKVNQKGKKEHRIRSAI